MFQSAKMDVVTGIITAPRKVVTLDASLETYFRQTLPKPHVFAEPGADKFYYKSEVVLHPNLIKRGCFDNWWYGVRYLLQHTKSDYILMLEDDISWCRDGWNMIQNHAGMINMDRSIISGWTSKVNADVDRGFGWSHAKHLNMYGLCGALCLLMSRKVIANILYNRCLTKVNRVHLDTDIGFAAQELGYDIWLHHPSLITHLGYGLSTFAKVNEKIEARHCYANCRPRRRNSI